MSLTPAKHGSSKTVKKAHLQDTDLIFVVSWLEDKWNFESVYETSGQTKIGVPIKNKITGLRDLAADLSRQSKGRLNVDHKGIKGRIRTYRKNLEVELAAERSTGFGVTEEDRWKGIFTVEQKLNRICAHFERMKALFGESTAVQPLLIDDSLAAQANSSDKDEEATGEVDVHHDETQLGDEMGSPASPLESPPGPGQEEKVRNSTQRNFADDVPPLPSPLVEPLVTPGQKRKAPTRGTTKDKRKDPLSLKNASMQSLQNIATALKETAQDKAIAIREADDKRLQWEKKKWEDDKRERKREKEERETTWAAEREEREHRWVVEREERARKLELEEREL
ncbi:hypothetical protein PsorP6_006417 [Peronosclerospora sorghi]|uniref:Uncharacterized protein n=1 Tax=Peronosclerospora sorghi TaxID=230839 RepID=A0ACC0W2R9_9STRA|nr:hypothetical protein PsorP6_006417 [Peronosclerospora sorghi]